MDTILPSNVDSLLHSNKCENRHWGSLNSGQHSGTLKPKGNLCLAASAASSNLCLFLL